MYIYTNAKYSTFGWLRWFSLRCNASWRNLCTFHQSTPNEIISHFFSPFEWFSHWVFKPCSFELKVSWSKNNFFLTLSLTIMTNIMQIESIPFCVQITPCWIWHCGTVFTFTFSFFNKFFSSCHLPRKKIVTFVDDKQNNNLLYF